MNGHPVKFYCSGMLVESSILFESCTKQSLTPACFNKPKLLAGILSGWQSLLKEHVEDLLSLHDAGTKIE